MRGERVGNYLISHLLGRGGMGAVYLAEHELLERPAAIKMLLPVFSAEADIVDRFFDEARAVSSIHHPGIVQIYDFGYHTDGRAYLVMEYLEGMSLDVRLDWSGALAPQRALRIARQIADSLEAAHVRGVIHRDLKLENVFLVHDPAVPGGERAKVLDFGIAKLERRELEPRAHTRTGAILGTPKYMSPEQCRDAHDVDARADVYSLGCVLFCMVTGEPPFDGPSAVEIMNSHLHEAPRRPSDVNPALRGPLAAGLDAVVARCLAKDPAARYASMSDVSRAIGEVLGEPGDAVGPEVSGATPAPTRSRSLAVDPTGPTLTSAAIAPAEAPRVPWRVPAACAAFAAMLGLFAVSRGMVDGPAAAGAATVSPVTAETAAPAPRVIVEPLALTPAPAPAPADEPPAPTPEEADAAEPVAVPRPTFARRAVRPAPAPAPVVASPSALEAIAGPAEAAKELADVMMSDSLMPPSLDEVSEPSGVAEIEDVEIDVQHAAAPRRSVVFDRLPGSEQVTPPAATPIDDASPDSVTRTD